VRKAREASLKIQQDFALGTGLAGSKMDWDGARAMGALRGGRLSSGRGAGG